MQNINATKIPIPLTYKDAVNDPEYGKLWQIAINDELEGLLSNGTWREEVAPPKTNHIGTKWVFSIKYRPDGTFDRLKARLVARGFSQKFGIDYNETFAPTVQIATLRAFLSIVAAEDLECWQFDMKNAFTESKMKETVYLKPPYGISVTKGSSLRVMRSLYGLKQSARDWNLLLRSEMLKWGFVQSLADPSKSLGEIEKILGMRITRDISSRTIFVDQEQYFDKILRKFGFPKPTYKAQKIPLDGYDTLRPASDKDERVDQREYSTIIGSVMFAMVYTRPDIAFALGRLSQFMKDPAVYHMAALKKVTSLLKVNRGL